VTGCCPTDRPSEAIFALACEAKSVSLCFLQGARMPNSLDPKKLLKGSGTTVRAIRLYPLALIGDRDVPALMTAAKAHAKVQMPENGKGNLVIRSVSTKQRPRRPADKSFQARSDISNRPL